LESVSAKTDAFKDLFSFAPEKVDEIVAFHLDNGGMSRYEKFGIIYSSILKIPLSQQRFLELSDEFASNVHQKVIDSQFVDGAKEFLEKYYGKIALYVVSATPEQELKHILRERQIIHFFISVRGSPEKKIIHLKEIMEKRHHNPSTTIFVGDAKNDYDASKEAGIRFIARIRHGDPDRFIGLPDIEYKIKDLYELDKYIGDLLC